MLNEQKSLLADIRAAQVAATALLTQGVKIGGIVQRLRGAGDELETRVRFLEKAAGASASPSPAIVATARKAAAPRRRA